MTRSNRHGTTIATRNKPSTQETSNVVDTIEREMLRAIGRVENGESLEHVRREFSGEVFSVVRSSIGDAYRRGRDE